MIIVNKNNWNLTHEYLSPLLQDIISFDQVNNKLVLQIPNFTAENGDKLSNLQYVIYLTYIACLNIYVQGVPKNCIHINLVFIIILL